MRSRKHFLPCACLVTAACLSFLAAVGVAQAERVFSGKLGNKYRIQMRLRREGGKLSGTYFYERIGYFDVSPDGKRIAVARGNAYSDVVLITNFR